MSSTTDASIDVTCPDCSQALVVPLAIIEQSQRLLAEYGRCTGLASFECPAPYFASLLEPREVARIGDEALREHEIERWESDGGHIQP